MNAPEEKERTAGIIESPERIMRDLLQTEKEIAAESLTLFRRRYEKEKGQWEAMLSEKERRLLETRARLEEASLKIKELQRQIDAESQGEIDRLKLASAEMESRKAAETKKWQVIEDEIRSFREAATDAQNKLLSERDRVIQLRKNFEQAEKLLKEQLAAKEEEILELKEISLKKEEAYLRDKALKEEEVSLLQEQVRAHQETITQERAYHAKVAEEKDKNIYELQKALQETIIQLTSARQKGDKLEEKIAELQKYSEKQEDEAKNMKQALEQERLSFQRALQEEQANFEKIRQEYQNREDNNRKENAEASARLTKSNELLEQQLNEEQRLRKVAESRLQQKDQELQQLIKQKDDVAADWKKIMSSERETWQRKVADAGSELEKVKQAKEIEITRLQERLNQVLNELTEEKTSMGHRKKKTAQHGGEGE